MKSKIISPGIISPSTISADGTAGDTRGPELVVNGTFNTDTANWIAGNSASLAKEAGQTWIRVTNGAAAAGFARQAITCEVGATYTLSGNLMTGTAQGVCLIGEQTTGSPWVTPTTAKTAPASWAEMWVATQATYYVFLVTNTATATLWTTYDNISVRRVI